MLRSLDSGVSALQQFQQSMDVIGNNIANVSTVGFKGANVNFADAFSQTLGSGSGGTMQVGTGVITSAIANQFTQGSITSTGVQTDMAISGNGFFMVNDPSASGYQYVTRDGQFHVDPNGYLVNSGGMRVQGYTDDTFTTVGDVVINNNGAAQPLSSYGFDKNGKITVILADGSSFVRGQVLLQNFTSPERLTKEGNNLFSGMDTAGPLAQPGTPGSSGLGTIVTASLEMSNVDLASQMASLITTQRAFQASARIVTTSDEILQELVNLKR